MVGQIWKHGLKENGTLHLHMIEKGQLKPIPF